MKLRVTKILLSKIAPYKTFFLFVLGILSTIWFLFRVIPKPSRAFYPCQRVAFPIASSFVIWLIGVITSLNLFRMAKRNIYNKNWGAAIILCLIGYIVVESSEVFSQMNDSGSGNTSKISSIAVTSNTVLPEIIDSTFATVSIVQSDQDSTSFIEYPEIESLVREAIVLSGGLSNLVSDSMTVCLKPNLVCDYEWGRGKKLPEGSNGMVTDYRVIQAVANIVRELNPNGLIYVIEGSAIGSTSQNLKTVGWDKITGIDSIIALEDASGAWAEFESDKLVSVVLPDEVSQYPHHKKPNKSIEYYLNKIYYEADVLISIPVLKNHSMSDITGSVKNVGIGGTPANIYGNGPSHSWPIQRITGIDHSNLTEWIHDFYICRPVDFTVVDGLQGSDYGPVGERSYGLSYVQKNMRLILAGKSAVSVDAISSLIMGYDPQRVGHLANLSNSGVGIVHPMLINVVGPDVEKIRVDFTGPEPPDSKIKRYESYDYMPDSIVYVQNAIKIFISDTSFLAGIGFKIDNESIKGVRVKNFNSFEIDISQVDLTDSLLTLSFTDRYLNTLDKQIKGSYCKPVQTSLSTDNFRHEIMKVYPNPVCDALNFQISNDVNGPYEIIIYNTSGKLVYREKMNKDTYSYKNHVNVGFLSPGNYYITFQSSGNVIVKGFVKQ